MLNNISTNDLWPVISIVSLYIAKIFIYYTERNGIRRREKELSSVSSFSEDEGVCEPCLAATEYSLQEQQNLAGCTSTQHISTCPFHSHSVSSPVFLEAGIDPEYLQRNFSLPSPVRRTSLITAERSRSWDHNCHTAQTHTHHALHTPTHKCIQFPFNTAQIPPFAKFTTLLPQKNIISSKGVVMNPVLVGKEGVEPMLSGAKANPELTAAYSRQDPFVQCSHCRDHAAKVEEPTTELKSIPAAIKSKVLGFFQRSFSPSRSSSPSPGNSDMSRRSKVKDEEYKKLVEYIMREEAELLHCERPALEHTVSAPESTEIFAVREFPMSSQVLKRRKSRSLDEPPVIPPPRVRRKSKSLDESPCMEMCGDSNESGEDNTSQDIQSHNVQDDRSIPQIYDKVLEAEQSCDSGNQSDSGVQDGVIIEEQYNNNDFIAHVRNDSGTVVEDREQSYEESDDEDKEQSDNESGDSSSESEAQGKSVNLESLASEQTVKEGDIPKKDEDTSMPRTSENKSTRSVSVELSARRNSLQLLHKQVSPVASNGSCSDRSSVETDCDEWARTTEAVIRSMQNQMLRRQSAIEDSSADFDTFTTSSSGDSRLGQLSYEDINNGTSPQSPPPLPPRRGFEASTVSSDGVSVTESPSDLEEFDVWKCKSNSPTENGSPVREYQLPASSIVRNGNNSSSDSSSASSSNQSSPGERPAYHRFYHVFREGELVDLIERHVDNLHILSCYYDHANWCVVAERVQVWRI